MKFAKSIKFGGQLVLAESCDYESYKKLGLICPECSNLVFLVKEQERESKKGKVFKVPAYFSHFKDTSINADRCELRVKQYSEKEVKKALNQARNQRLRFFQRWFWSLIDELKYNTELKPLKNILTMHDELYKENPHYAKRMYEVHDAVKKFLRSNKEELIMAWINSYVNEDYDLTYASPDSIFISDVLLKELSSDLDLNMHVQICLEALDFALSSKNRYQLTRLLYNSVVSVANAKGGEASAGLIIDKESLKIHAHVTVCIICLVPWASAFAEKWTDQATR